MTVHLAHLKLRSEFWILYFVFCIDIYYTGTGILYKVTIRYNVNMQQQLDVFFNSKCKAVWISFFDEESGCTLDWIRGIYNFCKINQSYWLVTNRLCKQIWDRRSDFQKIIALEKKTFDD